MNVSQQWTAYSLIIMCRINWCILCAIYSWHFASQIECCFVCIIRFKSHLVQAMPSFRIKSIDLNTLSLLVTVIGYSSGNHSSSSLLFILSLDFTECHCFVCLVSLSFANLKFFLLTNRWLVQSLHFACEIGHLCVGTTESANKTCRGHVLLSLVIYQGFATLMKID